jgi:hypothetical protein
MLRTVGTSPPSSHREYERIRDAIKVGQLLRPPSSSPVPSSYPFTLEPWAIGPQEARSQNKQGIYSRRDRH